MATDLPKRDESRDMWVYESGGDCLGVTEYSHYLEHGDDWSGEGEHYVPASDLDAIQRKLELSEAHVKALTIRQELEVPQLEADDKMHLLRNDLAASESARKLAVEEAAEARHAADAMRERLEAALKRVGELEQIVNFGGGEFARLKVDRDGNGRAQWWFSCHKCSELIDGTEDLSAHSLGPSVDGFGFRCSGCGQEYVGSTHVMLHEVKPITDEQSDIVESLLVQKYPNV